MHYFDHEKLTVYQKSVAFVAWSETLLAEVAKKLAVKNHLSRASAGVPINIAEGNARESPQARTRFLKIARGSATESAACLDVLVARESVTIDDIANGRALLREVVAMLTSLHGSISSRVADDGAPYGRSAHSGEVSFDHEKLDVYHDSIAFVSWYEGIERCIPVSTDVRGNLDRASTSAALNIAEGNGRFSTRDRCHFLETARTSALQCASSLDVLVARKAASAGEMSEGKEVLRRMVARLSALRKQLSAGD